MGFWDQLYLSWEDTERYQHNQLGLIEADSNGNITSNRHGPIEGGFGWTYRVLYSDNLSIDHTNPICDSQNTRNCWKNEAYWGVSQVTADTDTHRYHTAIGPYTTQEDGTKRRGHSYMNLLSDLYEPETEIAVRMWIRQSRHGNEYNDISNPTRIFLPAEMELARQGNTIRATWTKTYTQTIDHYQYRIGHNESGRQTEFSDWITICPNNLTENTSGADTQIRATISSTQPNPNSGTCGGDSTAPLQTGTDYRIQVRAVDESRSENQYVRNYVHTEKFTYSSAPPASSPPIPFGGGGNNPVVPSGGLGNPTSPTGVGSPSGDGPTQGPVDGSTTGFTDTAESVHQTNIVQLADMGVTRGCDPPENSRFCPDRAVTRAEMATFLTRAFSLETNTTTSTQTGGDITINVESLSVTGDNNNVVVGVGNTIVFNDTTGNIHANNIKSLAEADISRGCNPPTNDRFCPDRAVTRAEMATFMTRVLELEEEGNTEFEDTEGNVHATNIQRFAEAGITRGCNPPSNTRYCPDRAVTRAEMATFLVRSTALNNG